MSAQEQNESDIGSKTKSGNWLTRGLFTLSVLAAAVLIGYLFWGKQSEERDEDLTYEIKRGDVVVSVTEQGTLASSDNTEIKNKVRGFSVVTEVVEVGQVVKQDDILVRLDTKAIEEQLSTARTNVNSAKADLARSEANVKTNRIAIDAYLNGRYKSQLENLQRAADIAEARLKNAKKIFEQTKILYMQTFVNRHELEGHKFAVTQNELELEVQKNAIEVLNTYTKEMRLETLKGNLAASESKLESDKAALQEEEKRLSRIEQELKDCVIRAPRDGLVIYPSAAAWKSTPDIEEGASVRMDQVLLLMPNLDKMQVNVGIHESMVDQVNIGQQAVITLSDRDEPIQAKVSKVANVTKPAGWWTGNVVKYDTIIELPKNSGLKPGMSAEVEVILAKHEDVLKIPVAAVVELPEGSFCWVQAEDAKPEKRKLELGDSNDVYIVVESGIEEGEDVVLNPLAHIEEAQTEAQKLINETRSYQD